MAPTQERDVATPDDKGKRKQNWQNGGVASISDQTPYDVKLDIYNTWSRGPATGSFPPNIPSKGTTNQKWQNGGVASMSNQTPYGMKLDRYKNWSGIPATGSFPPTIPPKDSAQFTHVRGGQYGSVAGVQYSGRNAVGVECAWILAWQAPVEDAPPCPPNRVYAVCGLKSKIDTIAWDQVIMRLDMAPDNAMAIDSASKTSVEAAIHNLTPDTATLNATFTFSP